MPYNYPGLLADSDADENAPDSDTAEKLPTKGMHYSGDGAFDKDLLFNGLEDFKAFKLANEEEKPAAPRSKKVPRRKYSGGSLSWRSGSSASLSASLDWERKELVEIGGEAGYEELNPKFSGGHIVNTDLTRVDKGQGNP
mmetsp:Transcript_1799/g.2372  ORF Transcript_1799/g.2372 Transcript_1799/m.2372 type:complete len:140 (-) Transcript_1799:65-484(-)